MPIPSTPPSPLRCLFVDFNSFFASVEQELQPRLRGRPVAVLPVLAETTSCIAASREAKRCGVKTGTPVRAARRLCPEIVFVEARPREYVRMHHLLIAAVEDCVPVEAVLSIDEMHCRLAGAWGEPGPAATLAREIKENVARQVGPRLTSSIGLAPNVFLAKAASDMQKPDGLVTILPGDLPHVLHPLELRDFYGVGPNMERRLRRHGIATVAQLCAAPREALHAVWGSVEGERLFANLRGEEVIRPPAVRRTLGHSHVLPPELRTTAGARAVLHRLTQKAAMRLRAIQHLAGAMGIFLRFPTGRESADDPDRGTWTDELTFAPTDCTLELLRALDLLWTRRRRHHAASLFSHARPSPVAVGVNFLGLVPVGNHTPSLFEEDRRRRFESLWAAVDRINRLHGPHTVHLGGAASALRYTPMRIAFNRIPDPNHEA